MLSTSHKQPAALLYGCPQTNLVMHERQWRTPTQSARLSQLPIDR